MTKLDYLLKQHDIILGWYRQSEEKATFLVTLNTLVVGVVNGFVFIGADKVGPAHFLYTAPVWVILILSGIALVFSYMLVLRAMWPRHRALDRALRTTHRIWFFGDLACMTNDEHRAALANWTEQDLEATLAAQNQILSKSVWIKQESLNWAIALTIIGIILIFLLGLVYGAAIVNAPF